MATASSSKCTASSRASLGGYSGGSRRRRTQIYNGGGVRWRRFLAKICWKWLRLRGVKNPKGFGFYL
jgi:hypothetical protein